MAQAGQKYSPPAFTTQWTQVFPRNFREKQPKKTTSSNDSLNLSIITRNCTGSSLKICEPFCDHQAVPTCFLLRKTHWNAKKIANTDLETRTKQQVTPSQQQPTICQIKEETEKNCLQTSFHDPWRWQRAHFERQWPWFVPGGLLDIFDPLWDWFKSMNPSTNVLLWCCIIRLPHKLT